MKHFMHITSTPSRTLCCLTDHVPYRSLWMSKTCLREVVRNVRNVSSRTILYIFTDDSHNHTQPESHKVTHKHDLRTCKCCYLEEDFERALLDNMEDEGQVIRCTCTCVTLRPPSTLTFTKGSLVEFAQGYNWHQNLEVRAATLFLLNVAHK